jgi:hypothetical protein
MPPLQGHTRCLRHAGPKAARAHREVQLRALASGRLDPTVFRVAEQKREANRLRWLWKKHGPWISGSTIDLDVHEAAFANELRGAGWVISHLPPALIDRMRWKFRRLMLDRRKPEKWMEVLAELPAQVQAAGPPPEEAADSILKPATFSAPESLPTYSRRRRLNLDRDTCSRAPQDPIVPRGRKKPTTLAAGDLLEVLVHRRSEIAPVLARCETDKDRLRVAASYKRLLHEGSDPKAYRDWLAVLLTFTEDLQQRDLRAERS